MDDATLNQMYHLNKPGVYGRLCRLYTHLPVFSMLDLLKPFASSPNTEHNSWRSASLTPDYSQPLAMQQLHPI